MITVYLVVDERTAKTVIAVNLVVRYLNTIINKVYRFEYECEILDIGIYGNYMGVSR